MSRFEKVIHTYSNSISEVNESSKSGSGRAYVTEWLKPIEGDPVVLQAFYPPLVNALKRLSVAAARLYAVKRRLGLAARESSLKLMSFTI